MRHFFPMASLFPPRGWLCAFALSLSLVACRKEEISSYSAPKETPRPAVASAPPNVPASVPIHWTAPAGWEEQAASGMRVGSFTVTQDGKRADVSVIPLAGVSGSELDNVNRWRGQVGLPPVSPEKLSESGEKVEIGSMPAALYDLAGTDPQTKQPMRILASILSTGGTAWFFKMSGADTMVEAQKPAFKQFLKSVQFESGQVAEQPPQLPQSASPSMKDLASIPGHGGPTADKPTWTVPADWQEQPPTSMRLATFLITGGPNAKADVSVIKLSGAAGGNLANVNRWRGQIGLPPVDEAGLAKLATTQEMSGLKVTLVDMAGRSVESGEQARLLAAIVPRSGTTWFYKMVGNDALVAQQKEAFIKFIQSARYPNAS
jgi:hypothetical protein